MVFSAWGECTERNALFSFTHTNLLACLIVLDGFRSDTETCASYLHLENVLLFSPGCGLGYGVMVSVLTFYRFACVWPFFVPCKPSFKPLACNPSCITPVFDAMVEHKVVDEEIFAMCMNNDGGMIVLGGTDPTMNTSEPVYEPLRPASIPGEYKFYEVGLTNEVIVGDVAVKQRKSAVPPITTNMPVS